MSISVTASLLPIAPVAEGKATASIAGDASSKNPFQMLYSDMLKSRGHPLPGSAPESRTEKASKSSPADIDRDKHPAANANSAITSVPAIPAVPLDSPQGTHAPSKTEGPDTTPVTVGTPGNDASATVMQPIVLPNIPSATSEKTGTPPTTVSDTIRPARSGEKPSTAATGVESQAAAAQAPAGIPAKETVMPATNFAANLEGALTNANAAAAVPHLPENNPAPVTALTADLSAGTPAAATGLAQGQPAAAIEPATRELELRAHPSSPVWREGFTAQVNVLVGERVQSAEMRVHPPELGPIDIRIVTVDQQTNIVFTASHEETRRAIEDAMPRLREVLAESGVNLDSTSVNSDRSSGDTHRQAHSDAGRLSSQSEPRVSVAQVAMAPQRRSEGLIDTFA